MTKIIVIHDGQEVKSAMPNGDNVTVIGTMNVIVDEKEIALAVAQNLNLQKLELIEKVEFPEEEF